MADAPNDPDESKNSARRGDSVWTGANAAEVKRIIARYSACRQHSAIMSLLDLAQNRTSPMGQEAFHG